MSTSFTVNGKAVTIEVAPARRLGHVLREELGGDKEDAAPVHVGGQHTSVLQGLADPTSGGDDGRGDGHQEEHD